MSRLPGTRCRRRVYLMRHAEVAYFDAEGRPLDPRHVGLTQRGRGQAKAAGALLKEVEFDDVIISGMPRTRETAEIVLDGRSSTLREDLRLKEIRAGRLAAVPVDRRDDVIAKAYVHAHEPDACFIGGEPWGAFQQRVLAAWHELVLSSDWVNLLVVAHDAVNRVILSDIVGVSLKGLRAFEQDPACINVLEIDVEEGMIKHAFIRASNLTAYNIGAFGNHSTVMERVSAEFKMG